MAYLLKFTEWKTINEETLEIQGSNSKLNMLLQPTTYFPNDGNDIIFETVGEFLDTVGNYRKHHNMLKNSVDVSLHGTKEFNQVSKALFHIIESIRTRESDQILFDRELIGVLKNTNIVGLVEKNFGEVLSAVYYCTVNNKTNSKEGVPAIRFSRNNQTPLVDFYFNGKPISVKSHIGANASSFLLVPNTHY